MSVSSGATVRTVRIGLLGCGGVGQAVVRAVETSGSRMAEAGIHLECRAALVRDELRPRDVRVNGLTSDIDVWRHHEVDVIVEVLGGIEPARTLVAEALEAGIPVVTANKSLVAAHGEQLQALAALHGTVFSYEASVLAGVPCVNALARRPLASGAGSWAGILNGTSHYIVSAMARGKTFDDALVEAVTLGYAEPSSDADISGRDAAEKLTILLHLAGHTDVAVADLPQRSIAGLAPWHTDIARTLGGCIKPVAMADTGPRAGAWVGPAFVPTDHPFAQVHGVTNILSVGRGDSSVLFSGPGAGPEVTAATILDDVVEAASARRSRPALRPTASVPVAARLRSLKASVWCLALDHVSSSAGEIAEFLASAHLPAVRVAGEGPRLGILTAPTSHASLLAAIDAIEATGVSVSWWPALEVDRV